MKVLNIKCELAFQTLAFHQRIDKSGRRQFNDFTFLHNMLEWGVIYYYTREHNNTLYVLEKFRKRSGGIE